MTVRELINVLEETNFECRCDTYKGTAVMYTEVKEFNLNNFNTSSYGPMYVSGGGISIKKDGEQIGYFKYLGCLKNDEEMMKKEVVKIEKLKLSQYWNVSSSGNKYYDNSSELTIVVK